MREITIKSLKDKIRTVVIGNDNSVIKTNSEAVYLKCQFIDMDDMLKVAKRMRPDYILIDYNSFIV